MKNTYTIAKIMLMVCCLPPILLFAQDTRQHQVQSTKTPAWEKAKNNSWPGVVNEQTYWYKLDTKAKLLWSADGKNWEADADDMWTDKEGVFYKLDGPRLAQSTDGGNSWNETPEWKWLAVDGRWYRLDKDRTVWVSK